MSNAARAAQIPSPSDGPRLKVVSPGDDVDRRLVEETRREVNRLLAEIAELARSNCRAGEFFEALLSKCVAALAAEGGAVYSRHDGGEFLLDHAAQWDDANRKWTRALVSRVAEECAARIVPPGATSSDELLGENPTKSLLILCPIIVAGQTRSVVLIAQRAGGGPKTQQGYLRFLTQACQRASQWLTHTQLRQFDEDRRALLELDELSRSIHRRLDPTATAYAIANDGRRFVGCDRVAVAVRRGSSCRIECVSGLDSIDRRADELRRLGALCDAVVATGEPLWPADTDLPPQIERALQAYVDKSQSRSVALLPLRRLDASEDNPTGRSEICGALIVEQMAGEPLDDAARKRIAMAAAHAGPALANALDHHGIFLLPLWQALGGALGMLGARHFPKTLAAAALLLAFAAAMVLAPADFDMSAAGRLEPTLRRDVFAHAEGVIVESPLAHGDRVAEGQVVARLQSTELELEVAALAGERTTLGERYDAVQRALLRDGGRLSPTDRDRMEGELSELTQARDDVERRLKLLEEKQAKLVVRSPMAGEVITWRVRDRLLHRPVEVGQSLLTIADPSGPWELELQMPERRMCHIHEAAAASEEPLDVAFTLASHPGREFRGQVVEIARTLEATESDGNTALIRVAIDEEQLPDLRAGSLVTARVHCGRRSLGEVVFCDLIETVQSKVLFWIP